MIGSHKILTVSYGTFSCTLEGFEDSFGTMKAIAEYFRDLAADDRYFGAEPPTPDAEMLARIAEREVARRVEARLDASGIVLRVGHALDESAPPAAAEAPAARPAPQPAPPPQPGPVAAAPAAPPAPARIMPEVAAPVAPSLTDADSIAAKLQRIRDVVGRQPAALDAADAEDVAPAATLPPVEAPEAAPEPAPEPAPALTAPAERPEDRAAPLAEAAAAPIRARVIRMRRADFDRALAAAGEVAPVGSAAAVTAAALADGSEDEDADVDGDLAVAAAEPAVSVTLSAEDEAELMAELAALEVEADSIDGAEDAALIAEAEDDLADAFETEEADDGILAAEESQTMDKAEGSALPHGLAEGDPTLAEDEAEAAFDAAEASRDDDFAAARPNDATDETDDTEDDILGRVAAVATVAPAAVAAEAKAAGTEAAPVHAHLLQEPEADAAALDRILARTEADLSDPVARGRREALANLKAAVAATEAARRLGDAGAEDGDEETENAFRDDLRQVVRPRRPVPATEGRSERPRLAPLKLVASQRVDLPRVAEKPAATVTVRPRRVSIASDAPTAPTAVQHGSFADFAESMGAKGLADLLEAAAAYTAFVEGIEDFSRPQLMKKVSQMTTEGFSREDTLRSFGTLLRDGRITRAGTGRFQIAADSRFNPQRQTG